MQTQVREVTRRPSVVLRPQRWQRPADEDQFNREFVKLLRDERASMLLIDALFRVDLPEMLR